MSTPRPDLQYVLTELTDRISALEHWRAQDSDEIHKLQARLNPPVDTPQLLGADIDWEELVEWVHQHVTSIITRPLRGEIKWCPRWWAHSEAVLRLEALRLAWEEHVVAAGGSMSSWIRDHLDPCVHALTNPLGTFADCSHSDRAGAPNEHRPVTSLPTLTCPELEPATDRHRAGA